MTTQNLNIANALLTAKKAVRSLLDNGISGEEKIYELSKAIGTTFKLTPNQTLIIMEEALKIA
ncbi:hypothetical protein Freya10_1 [Polaribacter phage Freya_10]|nr:hypothetical protein Freya9_1 [Polaribacter phage Freya_9]QQV91294.1 hypothetical protein Freya10_1 [Polaribacter phage Freya_10]